AGGRHPVREWRPWSAPRWGTAAALGEWVDTASFADHGVGRAWGSLADRLAGTVCRASPGASRPPGWCADPAPQDGRDGICTPAGAGGPLTAGSWGSWLLLGVGHHVLAGLGQGPAVVTHRGTAQPQQAGEPVGGNVAAMLFNGGQDPLAGRQAGGTASGVVGLRTRSPASSASAVAALRGGAFAQVDANSANPATGLGQARTEPGRERLDGTIRGRRGIDLGPVTVDLGDLRAHPRQVRQELGQHLNGQPAPDLGGQVVAGLEPVGLGL